MAYVYAAEGGLRADLFARSRHHALALSGRLLGLVAADCDGDCLPGRRPGGMVWSAAAKHSGASRSNEPASCCPLLPVIGFWFVDSQTNYSVLLLVVGGLYAALAVTRKSMGFGLLAALAANGGLWHYLHKLGGVGLLEHPQLWLIPPALCVLAAAYLNRDRLTPSQMTTVRYITSMTIYLSSTADIFIQGVDQAPWLPLVLGAFALAGVFAGILLRVRGVLVLRHRLLDAGHPDDDLARRHRVRPGPHLVHDRHRGRHRRDRDVRAVRETPAGRVAGGGSVEAVGGLSPTQLVKRD